MFLTMFKIGDFSRLTRISIKMLRHYDEIGLLQPAQVDRWTGYRYYSANQLTQLNRIILLKDMGFSLQQIKIFLSNDLNTEQIKGIYKLRRAEVETQIAAEQARLTQIETRLRLLEQADARRAPDIILRPLQTQLVATIRQQVATLDEPIAAMFDEVEGYVAQHGARAPSSPFTLFHDAEYREEACDVEVAVPIVRPIPNNEQIRIHEISGSDTMACMVYTGSYDRLAEVLHEMLIWLDLQGYAMAGPIREVYLRYNASRSDTLRLDPAFLTDDQRMFVTEVQIPVEKLQS